MRVHGRGGHASQHGAEMQCSFFHRRRRQQDILIYVRWQRLYDSRVQSTTAGALGARETTLDAAVKMTRQSVPTGSWPTLYVICVWNAITVKLDTVTRSLTVLRIKIQSTSADCQLEWQSVERIPRPVVKQLWRWWSDFEARYVKKISQDDVKTVVDVATYLRIS